MSPLERRAQVQARILELLPANARTLAQVLAMSTCRVQLNLKRMYGEGLIHVGGWEAGLRPGMVGRIWHVGPGPDVPMPNPSPKAVAARKYRKTHVRDTGSVSGRDWVLGQLGKHQVQANVIRQGNRTAQALNNIINRLAADGLIAVSQGRDQNGHPVRLLRKGKPRTDEELEAQEVARDRVAALVKRNRRVPEARSEMLSMIWATAAFRRAA